MSFYLYSSSILTEAQTPPPLHYVATSLDRLFLITSYNGGILKPECEVYCTMALTLMTFLESFPWQEKLVAPLIANLIGYSQCKDRVTKSEGKRTATGYISDLFA